MNLCNAAMRAVKAVKSEATLRVKRDGAVACLKMTRGEGNTCLPSHMHVIIRAALRREPMTPVAS